MVLSDLLNRRKNMLTVDHACKSDRGDRDENQDATGSFLDPKGDFYCFALADGLGGHQSGSRAAELAIMSLMKSMQRASHDDLLESITEAIYEAHDHIRHTAASDPELEGMQTTCVLAVIHNGFVYFASVGDSRSYLARDGEILYQTRDDSVVQMLLDMGEIHADQLADHPDRNRILKALGMDGNFNLSAPPYRLEIKRGDCILLCSDGFWENFSDSELTKVLGSRAKALAPEKILEILFDVASKRAEQQGRSQDNLTAQLVVVH